MKGKQFDVIEDIISSMICCLLVIPKETLSHVSNRDRSAGTSFFMPEKLLGGDY
jgi:hypothetical protein